MFESLENQVKNRTCGLDVTIKQLYPNFIINPLKRHTSSYDIYLYLLCYVAEINEKKKSYEEKSGNQTSTFSYKETTDLEKNQQTSEMKIKLHNKHSLYFRRHHDNISAENKHRSEEETPKKKNDRDLVGAMLKNLVIDHPKGAERLLQANPTIKEKMLPLLKESVWIEIFQKFIREDDNAASELLQANPEITNAIFTVFKESIIVQ